jgi:hypothetical protein
MAVKGVHHFNLRVDAAEMLAVRWRLTSADVQHRSRIANVYTNAESRLRATAPRSPVLVYGHGK